MLIPFYYMMGGTGPEGRRISKQDLESKISELEEKLSGLSSQITKKPNVKSCVRCARMFEGVGQFCRKCSLTHDKNYDKSQKLKTMESDYMNNLAFTRSSGMAQREYFDASEGKMVDPRLMGTMPKDFESRRMEKTKKKKPSNVKKLLLKIGFAQEVKK